ncbi:MAG: helix-turn-helix transcriptional regulator [Clostridiales bacterium]|nr:helix-turn-helix transcriptional regulator [Clostridiales bacterium]
MHKITDELLKELKNADDIQAFLDSHEQEFISETPVDYLNYIINSRKTSIAEIAKKSGVGNYVYKVFNNERKPSREVMIAIALGIGLSLEEAQLLLRISKFAILDSRDKRDSIIIYGFINHLTVFEVDDLLANNDFITIN